MVPQERGVTAAVGPDAKLVSSDDVLILEDEKARMVLRGAEKLIKEVVTGIYFAIKTDVLDVLLRAARSGTPVRYKRSFPCPKLM